MQTTELSYSGINGDTAIMVRRGHERIKVADVYDEELKPVIVAAPNLLRVLQDLRKALRESRFKMDVRKDFSLMNADACAGKLIFNVEGNQP